MDSLFEESIHRLVPDGDKEEIASLARRCVRACGIYVRNNHRKLDDERMELIKATKMSSLIDKLNKDNIKKVMSDDIRIKDIISENIHDVDPILRELKETITDRLKEDVEENILTLFKCPGCKERKHITRQVQLKSLDEASSSLNTCVNCGKRWIVHG